MFSGEKWHRAEVLTDAPEGAGYEVLYVDFGNVPASELAIMDGMGKGRQRERESDRERTTQLAETRTTTVRMPEHFFYTCDFQTVRMLAAQELLCELHFHSTDRIMCIYVHSFKKSVFKISGEKS